MVERTGINLPVVDLGWPPLSAITWGSPIAPFVIPLTILINVAMLALNKTRTVDVDMWNYWHFALAGTLVYYSSGSLFFGLLAAAIAAVVVLKLADWSAPLVQKILWPGRDLFADALFGGVLSGRSVGRQNHRPYPRPQSYSYRSGNRTEKVWHFRRTDDGWHYSGHFSRRNCRIRFQKVLLLGISIGGVMFILPRMVRILMEGLLPLSEAIKKYLNAKYPDRDDLYIGLDIAVAVGNPAIISTALLLTPISVFIAFVLPGNEVLPLGDLANLAVMASMIALASRGNIFRTVLAAIPVIIADLWIATKIAPFITGMAKDVNFKFAEGSSGQVSSFLDGGNPFRFWLLEIFNGNLIAIALVPVIALVLYGIFRMTRSTVYA